MRGTVDELVTAIIELYGEGLARIVDLVSEDEALLRALAQDSVIGSLLLIHDLYPVPLETRVQEALASVRPYMESHGGDVELLRLEDGIAHLRLVGHCHGCPASAATLELAIKEAIDDAAPDLLGLEVEGVAEPKPVRKPLDLVEGAAGAPHWQRLEQVASVAPGTFRTLDLDGVELVVANVDGSVLAYRDRCAVCDASLREAELAGPLLTCAACGCTFDLPRAGRALGRGGPARSRAAPAARRARVRGGARLMAGRAAPAVRRLRSLSQARRPPPAAAAPASTDRCDLCGTTIDAEHRHLLHLVDRRILCSCEPCFALRSGDAELRPTGTRVRRLDDFALDDDLWARFQIPIALAFFMARERGQGVIALYPSPAGATECELHLEAWDELVAANPLLAELEPEVEALIVNRLSEPARYAVVPIDRCYELVGMIKSRWEGISGGRAIEGAVADFFASLDARAGL